MLQRLLTLPIIFGVCLITFGLYKLKVSKVAYYLPQSISYEDLAQNGPGENAHIELYDFTLCEDGFVYLESEDSGRWKKVWVPAISGAENENAPCAGVKVLIEARNVRNQRGAERLYEEQTLQGIVLNAVDPLGRREREELEQMYPEIDFDSCWLLAVGESPVSAQTARNFVWFGGMLIAIGVGGKILLLWYE